MRVVVVPGDAWACGYYRLIWPANCLQMQGWDEVIILPPNDKHGFLVKTETDENGIERLVELTAPECDLIILQRPGHYLQPQLIVALRKAGIAVIVDMDDDMSKIASNHVAYHIYNPKSATKFSWKTAMEACKVATMVTTSTAQLMKVYAPHGRGMVLDNYVPEAYLDFDEERPEPGFGWAGTVSSHPDDLWVLGNSVNRLMAEGHKFTVVGDGKKITETLRLRHPYEVTGPVALEDWARTVQRSLHIGMVPLASTAFNASKSRLKGIEYMAGGVPWVASPRQEYRRLNRESGCGLLADTPKQWYEQLKRLLTDEVLYKEQVEMGREYMKDQTLQAQAWRWAEAWTKAVEMQQCS